ncbi:MAG: DUF58 domain-containing protein [Candidatus Promineifilaceae bacterium]|nr:DUF58 domain-containing protein [Candidatus Promineifilaceae bacterium]
MASTAEAKISRRIEDTSQVTIQLRIRLPLVWLGVLFIGAFLLPDRIWNTLLVGFGGLFIVAYIWVWLLSRGLQGSRRLRFGWVAVGDRLSEEFIVTNHAEIPALWVEIIDHSDVPGYRPAIVRSIGSRGGDRWRESAVCLRRGLFHLGPWAIRSSDPFGIFIMQRTYPQVQEIIIHPPIHGQLPIPLPLGESSGRVRARQRSWQATVNAASIRDYLPRDPLNRIHWPSSARRGRLTTRQFDLDAAGDIWIFVDMQEAVQLAGEEDWTSIPATHLTPPASPGQAGSASLAAGDTEEHAVLLAASLAARAGRHNRAVGLAAYGREPYILPPARGEGQQWKILRALALVTADGETTLDAALRDLSRVVQKGAAAIIITPNSSASWLPELTTLAKSGVQSNIILLDRPSFGGRGRSQPQLEAVRQLGFSAHVIRRGEVGQPLQEQVRRGFWEFKVTGTGKVITVSRPDD